MASTWWADCTVGSTVTDTCRPPTASRTWKGGSTAIAKLLPHRGDDPGQKGLVRLTNILKT